MRASRTSTEERYRLIVECRRSGLTDHQWCTENNINPGTFYNWVRRFRQEGYPDIPESNVRPNRQQPQKNEIVRIDFATPLETVNSPVSEQFAMEIFLGNSTIRISNGINPELLRQTLSVIGGMTC